MKWLYSGLCAALLVLAWASALPAALCEKCRGKMYTTDIGVCISCGGHTSSGAFKLCAKCSAAQGRCEHCLGPLAAAPQPVPPQPAPPQPVPPRPLPPRLPVAPPVAPPEQREPIQLDKTRTYVWEQWKYEFRLSAAGTRSEGRFGRLYYAGKELPPAEINDYYEAPWGKLYWVGTPKVIWGDHGWMPRPNPVAQRQGRRLVPPEAGPAGLDFSMADDGHSVEVPLGAVVTIRLEGNITTGYSWQTAQLAGEALESLGKPDYVEKPHAPGMVGVGGVFVFKFKAVKPGKAAVRLVYLRPWEKDKPPERTFGLTVEVKPAEPPGEPQPVPGQTQPPEK